MPVPHRDRARHMTLRFLRAAERVGVDHLDLLEAAHSLAMEPRHEALDDDHDPRYLHPGRTALVAMGDGGIRDPWLLAAALLLETVDRALEVPDDGAEKGGHPGLGPALRTARGIPRPDDPSLVEKLVTADEGERAVALSEWLDQLRHLRNWADPETVSRAQDLTREIYLPVAERGHGVIARRFRWWMRRVDPGLSASW